jgi:hypothetical protein
MVNLMIGLRNRRPDCSYKIRPVSVKDEIEFPEINITSGDFCKIFLLQRNKDYDAAVFNNI